MIVNPNFHFHAPTRDEARDRVKAIVGAWPAPIPPLPEAILAAIDACGDPRPGEVVNVRVCLAEVQRGAPDARVTFSSSLSVACIVGPRLDWR